MNLQIVIFDLQMIICKSFLGFPLVRGHPRSGLEGAEEGLFGGETGTDVHFSNLHLRLTEHQFFGVVDTILIDKL